jgi:hypothetical protein
MNNVTTFTTQSAGVIKTFELDVSKIPPETIKMLVETAMWVDAEFGGCQITAEDESALENLGDVCSRIEALFVKVDEQPS